jgi:hypothetical protein
VYAERCTRHTGITVGCRVPRSCHVSCMPSATLGIHRAPWAQGDTRSRHVAIYMPKAPLGIHIAFAVSPLLPLVICRASLYRRPHSAYDYMPSAFVCRASSPCLPTRRLPKAICRVSRSAYVYAECFPLYAERIVRSAINFFHVVRLRLKPAQDLC